MRSIVTGFLSLLIFISCTTTKVVNDNNQIDNSNITIREEPTLPTTQLERKIYQSSYPKKFDLIHTKLEVSFDWEKRHLFGKATIQAKPHFYPQSILELDAKGFDIHEIVQLDGDNKEALSFDYDGLKLKINLTEEIDKTKTITIFIKYTAKTYELNVGGSDAILEDRGLYFINHDGKDSEKPQQIWTQGETEANSCWFPTIDAPNQKSTQEMYITVENRFKTLSNGDLIYSQLNGDSTRTDYWRMNQPHAPYLFMMAVGEFDVIDDSMDNLLVDYYVEPKYAPYAKDIFGDTPEMISYFGELFDYPYPWSKYSQIVVRDYVSGAMENTTASLFMEELQMTSRELIDDGYIETIAHELMHQWFGDLVTCESWANLTLNEGFASYGEYLWTEHTKKKKDTESKLYSELNAYLGESRSKNVDLIRFDFDDKEKMFDNHSYAKGGLVLHMLREYVGDEAFFKALNVYLKTNEYSSVEVHDLRLAFEEVTGEDLNWFFNQWFLAKGHPKIDVVDHYVDSTNTLFIYTTQTQDLQEFPLYKLPVDISIITSSNNTLNETIWIENLLDTFQFKLKNAPQLLLINSEEDLVAEFTHDKETDEWIVQSQMAKNAISRLKAFYILLEDTTMNHSDNIYHGLSDEYEEVRVLALDYARQMGDSLVFAWEKEIVQIAKNDENNEVRSEAIFTLYESLGDKYIDLYRSTVHDSSYLVAGSSLFAILQLSESEEEMNKLVDQFFNDHNVNVVLPLANYFMLSEDTTKLNWYMDQIIHGKTEVQYYLLRMIGQYMLSLNDSSVNDGINLISDFALNDNKYYLRIAALQSLQLFEDNQFAKEKIEQIVLNEKDERVRRFIN